MRYIKIFENFQNLENIKRDIEGIFIGLNDEEHFIISNEVSDNRIQVHIDYRFGRDSNNDPNTISPDVFQDEVLMLTDYIKHVSNGNYTVDYQYWSNELSTEGWVSVDDYYSDENKGIEGIKSDEFDIIYIYKL